MLTKWLFYLASSLILLLAARHAMAAQTGDIVSFIMMIGDCVIVATFLLSAEHEKEK